MFKPNVPVNLRSSDLYSAFISTFHGFTCVRVKPNRFAGVCNGSDLSVSHRLIRVFLSISPAETENPGPSGRGPFSGTRVSHSITSRKDRRSAEVPSLVWVELTSPPMTAFRTSGRSGYCGKRGFRSHVSRVPVLRILTKHMSEIFSLTTHGRNPGTMRQTSTKSPGL